MITKEEKIKDFKKTIDELMENAQEYYGHKREELTLNQWNENFEKMVDSAETGFLVDFIESQLQIVN
jgi:hypothetical protein